MYLIEHKIFDPAIVDFDLKDFQKQNKHFKKEVPHFLYQ